MMSTSFLYICRSPIKGSIGSLEESILDAYEFETANHNKTVGFHQLCTGCGAGEPAGHVWEQKHLTIMGEDRSLSLEHDSRKFPTFQVLGGRPLTSPHSALPKFHSIKRTDRFPNAWQFSQELCNTISVSPQFHFPLTYPLPNKL